MSQFKVFLLLASLSCPGLLILGSILNIFKESRHSPLELAPFVFIGGVAFTLVACSYFMLWGWYSIGASKVFVRKRDKLGAVLGFSSLVTSITAMFYYIWYRETWNDFWFSILCFAFAVLSAYIQKKQFESLFKYEKNQ